MDRRNSIEDTTRASSAAHAPPEGDSTHSSAVFRFFAIAFVCVIAAFVSATFKDVPMLHFAVIWGLGMIAGGLVYREVE